MKANDFSSVRGKVAIVTGAASGIGRALAQTFAANGMKVIIADIQDELGQRIAEEICTDGGEAIYCHTDISKEDEIIRAVEAAKKTYGKLHVMVNNAGIGCEMHPVHEYTIDVVKRVTDIRSCTNSRRTHLDGKFSACLCQKTLKYIQYSCAFLASVVKKFARQSAHFGYWYSFSIILGPFWE